MDRHTLKNGHIEATVKAHGAELCSLRDAEGREYLWQAGPAWPRHAPNLFPIVGRLKDDTLRHRGRDFRMTQHGFARDMRFEWLEKGETQCRLALKDDEDTKARYPFPFLFEVGFALEGTGVAVTYAVTNTGSGVLPAAIGAHPAFAWPLPGAGAKNAHSLVFGAPESAPTKRLAGGLLSPEPWPCPVENRLLPLDESLFAQDAVIFDRPASRSVRYEAPGAAAITVTWDEGFRELGLWARTGGDFLCIEPWRGMSSPEGFDGDIADKPGMMLIPPGETRAGRYTIAIG